MALEQTVREARVKAAVILRQGEGSEKQNTTSVINEESNQLIFIHKAGTEMKEHSFTFDGVFSPNTGQDKVFSDLVRSLLEPVASGYNVALLVCGSDSPEKKALLRGDGRQSGIVQQVIENIFQATTSSVEDEECLLTASFIQFFPDGKVQDVFHPRNQELKAVNTSIFGMVVDGTAEVVLSGPDETYDLYLQGLETAQEPYYSTLFSITFEQKKAASHTAVKRSLVQIFDLKGGDPQSQKSPAPPLLRILQNQDQGGSDDVLLSILKQTLKGNTLCLLLYCLKMEDLPGEEIVSALSVASHLREMSKTVSPVQWDPEESAQKLRREVKELRSKLLCSDQPEDIIGQLGQALKELQVVKNQRWEKKKTASVLLRENITRRLQGHQQSTAAPAPERALMGNQQQLPLADKEKGNQRLSDDFSQDDAVNGKVIESSCDYPCGCSKIYQVKTGEDITKQMKERLKEICHQTERSSTSAGSQQLDMDLAFSLAQARRHWLKEQHRTLIQRELIKLEQETHRDEVPVSEQEAVLRLQRERSVMVLQLEALRRERSEAERDVGTLFQYHKQETGAQKRHVLQVFQAYRGLLEEQMDALERRYRKLLEDSIKEAVCLSTRNQQLKAENCQLNDVVKKLQEETTIDKPRPKNADPLTH